MCLGIHTWVLVRGCSHQLVCLKHANQEHLHATVHTVSIPNKERQLTILFGLDQDGMAVGALYFVAVSRHGDVVQREGLQVVQSRYIAVAEKKHSTPPVMFRAHCEGSSVQSLS